MPMRYLVSWEIDIDSAANPVDAARQAFAHMQREGSIANVFMVQEVDSELLQLGDIPEAVKVDLDAVDDGTCCRTCGQEYPDGGDGYDGECPDCADYTSAQIDEQENEEIMRAKGWHLASRTLLDMGFMKFQHDDGAQDGATTWTELMERDPSTSID